MLLARRHGNLFMDPYVFICFTAFYCIFFLLLKKKPFIFLLTLRGGTGVLMMEIAGGGANSLAKLEAAFIVR